MPTTLVIRPATWNDLQAIGEFITDLGYTARRDVLRGIGDRMLQYAKGLAAERGWVRLESVVTRRREAHRRGFLLSRGFVQADSVTYRWGLLEGRHQAPPTLHLEMRPRELV